MQSLRNAGSFVLRVLSVVVYAVGWLLAWLIVLIVATVVRIDFLIRPTRRIHVPEPKDPNHVLDTLRRAGITAAVSGRYIKVPARDAERAREWVYLDDMEGGA